MEGYGGKPFRGFGVAIGYDHKVFLEKFVNLNGMGRIQRFSNADQRSLFTKLADDNVNAVRRRVDCDIIPSLRNPKNFTCGPDTEMTLLVNFYAHYKCGLYDVYQDKINDSMFIKVLKKLHFMFVSRKFDSGNF